MTKGVDETWRATLFALLRRNGAAEVAGIPSKPDELPPSFRVRLLATSEGGGLLIEKPTQPEAARYLRQGAVVKLLIIDGTQRWEMTSSVVGLTGFQLNAVTRVPALELVMPTSARSAQRRTFFRVSVAGASLKPVVLTPVPPEAPSPEAPPPEVSANEQHASEPDPDAPIAFFGKLVNISAGGIGVEAPQRVSEQLPHVARYRCRLELPTIDEPLEIVAHLVHLESLQGGTHYMGLSFEFDDRQHKQQCSDMICRYSAWHQRQQIQRMKGT